MELQQIPKSIAIRLYLVLKMELMIRCYLLDAIKALLEN